MIRKWCNQKEIPIPKTTAGKELNTKVLIHRKHIVSRGSSYFPNRQPLSYPNLTKNMKAHKRANSTKMQHQNIQQIKPESCSGLICVFVSVLAQTQSRSYENCDRSVLYILLQVFTRKTNIRSKCY